MKMLLTNGLFEKEGEEGRKDESMYVLVTCYFIGPYLHAALLLQG